MSPAEELEVLAIEARHLTALAKAMGDRLSELSDPHYEFRSHVAHMSTVALLCANTQSLVESVARTAKKHKDPAVTGGR